MAIVGDATNTQPIRRIQQVSPELRTAVDPSALEFAVVIQRSRTTSWDYPRDKLEFESRFSSEEACCDYLFALCWPAGFRCPVCEHERAWPRNVHALSFPIVPFRARAERRTSGDHHRRLDAV